VEDARRRRSGSLENIVGVSSLPSPADQGFEEQRAESRDQKAVAYKTEDTRNRVQLAEKVGRRDGRVVECEWEEGQELWICWQSPRVPKVG
jgi:hypothetical protein